MASHACTLPPRKLKLAPQEARFRTWRGSYRASKNSCVVKKTLSRHVRVSRAAESEPFAKISGSACISNFCAFESIFFQRHECEKKSNRRFAVMSAFV